jgi:hypothetical protein
MVQERRRPSAYAGGNLHIKIGPHHQGRAVCEKPDASPLLHLTTGVSGNHGSPRIPHEGLESEKPDQRPLSKARAGMNGVRSAVEIHRRRQGAENHTPAFSQTRTNRLKKEQKGANIALPSTLIPSAENMKRYSTLLSFHLRRAYDPRVLH